MIGFGKKSVIWKWLISYFCIILVSAICNFVTYYRSQSIIKERQEKINEVVLEQASDKIHDCIVMMESLREEILVNPDFTSLISASLSPFTSTTYKQYLLYTDLNTYIKLNDSYSHLMLYFAGDNKIIADNSVNTSENYLKIYNDILGLGAEQWNSLINGTYNRFHSFNITDGVNEGTLYVRTIQPEQSGRQKVNLFVYYSRNDWEKLLSKYQYSRDTSMLMLDEQGKSIIFDAASLNITNQEEQAILESVRQGKTKVKLGGNEVVHLNYLDNGASYSLCILTPEKIFLETVQQFEILFNFIFFTTLLFSLILIVAFIQYNYKPVKDLIKSLEPNEIPHEENKPFRNENEFAIVSKSVAHVKDKFQTINSALKRQNQLLQRVYLSRVLSGSAKILPEKELKEIYDIYFPYHRYAVLLFFVEDFMDDNFTDNIKPDEMEIVDLDHAQFILVNAYSEIVLENGWAIHHTKIDDVLALIISFPPEEDSDNQLRSMINSAGKYIINTYNLDYSSAVSNIHDDLLQLSVAYQEALQALEAKKLYDLDNVVHYKEVAELSGSSYHYPYEMEQNLMRYIQLNNCESAMSVFEDVIKDNINSKKIVSHDIIRCLMFDLLGTVVKTFDAKKESQDFIRQLKPAKRLSECSDLKEMKKVFKDILFRCCEYFKPAENSDAQDNICYQITKYIRENYWDTNLLVTTIANHFSLSPVEMSKMFREITGTKISVVLAEIRVQEAKKLILSSNANLAEIADKVGFGSTKTFTRLFKQVEGCTPGQWRDMQKIVS